MLCELMPVSHQLAIQVIRPKLGGSCLDRGIPAQKSVASSYTHRPWIGGFPRDRFHLLLPRNTRIFQLRVRANKYSTGRNLVGDEAIATFFVTDS